MQPDTTTIFTFSLGDVPKLIRLSVKTTVGENDRSCLTGGQRAFCDAGVVR